MEDTTSTELMNPAEVLGNGQRAQTRRQNKMNKDFRKGYERQKTRRFLKSNGQIKGRPESMSDFYDMEGDVKIPQTYANDISRYRNIKSVADSFALDIGNAAYAVDTIPTEDIAFAYFIHKLKDMEFNQAIDSVAQLTYTVGEAKAYKRLSDLAQNDRLHMKDVINWGMDISELEWKSFEDPSLNGHREINMSSLHVVLEPHQLHELRNGLYSSSTSKESLEDQISFRERVA